jgi:hypothetical protein
MSIQRSTFHAKGLAIACAANVDTSPRVSRVEDKTMTESKWVLAYDDRCSSCSRKAKAIAEATAGKLRILSLLDAEVVSWRRDTGHADVWQPMLFRVLGDSTQAFTGTALVLQLARILRPRRALRVVRMIASADVDADEAKSPDRRRFLRTATLAGVSVASLGVVGKLAFGNAAGPKRQVGQLLSERKLLAGDSLLTSALSSAPVSAIAETHGRDALGPVFVHAAYAGTELEAVGFQLNPKSGPSRLVYAYFHPSNTAEFRLVQLEIVPDASYKLDSPFSGSARVLAHDESVIGSAVFGGGHVLSYSQGSPLNAAVVPYGEHWDCFGYCLNNQWNHLPWWIQVGCVLACGGCIGAPELAIPCGACLGCVGGYAAGCFWGCWW